MKNKFSEDTIYVVETNIDDMSPVVYETVFEKLYAAGALEVFLTPVQMKKVRPGVLLTALTPPDKLKKIAEVILRETTSFGVRYHKVKRLKLIRKKTVCGKDRAGIRINKGYIGRELVRLSPEYGDCRKAVSGTKALLKDII
ncbi:MAG: nickel insertion protein [Candidatus Omnitrophota bacterium]|jgi:hypothetical protein